MAAQTMLEVDRQIVEDMYRRRNEQLVEDKTSYFTKKVEPKIRSLALESHRVLFWVRRFIACTPNLLVTSFSDMDCLITLMQMTHSYI